MTSVAGYPQQIWSPARPELRQGDLAVTFCHQLRAAKNDPEGPGPADAATEKIPYFGDYQDIPVTYGQAPDNRNLVLRVWPCWAMVLFQSCELDHQEEDDSRVLVAPIVFEPKWPGDHWGPIRDGQRAGYLYLPPMESTELPALKARGWPTDTHAAVALASASVISKRLLTPKGRFSLSPHMTMVAQHRLVSFFSMRNWSRSEHADIMEGMKVVGVRRTSEVHPGPGPLFKVVLEGDDDSDEMNVDIVLAP